MDTNEGTSLTLFMFSWPVLLQSHWDHACCYQCVALPTDVVARRQSCAWHGHARLVPASKADNVRNIYDCIWYSCDQNYCYYDRRSPGRISTPDIVLYMTSNVLYCCLPCPSAPDWLPYYFWYDTSLSDMKKQDIKHVIRNVLFLAVYNYGISFQSNQSFR